MKTTISRLIVILFLFQGISIFAGAQTRDSVINRIVREAENNSQLERLAYELLDSIGPRLVGTPQMKQAHDWAVAKFTNWGITARNQQWGEWRAWERGVTHIDLVHPRVRTLEGMQLAWSPGTKGKTVTAEVIAFPDLNDSVAYAGWMKTVKGKFVLISMPQPTGRPDKQWEEFGTAESVTKMKAERELQNRNWNERFNKSGFTTRTLPLALEKAGAAGVISSYWSRGFGVNKIFGTTNKAVPHIDIALEDYGMLYRLAVNGARPRIRLQADSKDLGIIPTFNTIAEIRGTEKPDEYVILSAHFDSWDGSQGATDNGTGTMVMMEAARILKQVYPNPKRTILVGLWGSEEQGLNGSRGFVADNPQIVQKTQAVFNQDNGTGRVTTINGQGFLHAYEFIGRWLAPVPDSIKKHITTTFPGSPGGGGSDHASFVAAGIPAFMLSSLSWDYGTYTWHTNRDSYDKIVFDDVRSNAILTAILTYMASEDSEMTNRQRINLPVNPRTGNKITWPEQRQPNRKGGMD